VCEVVPGVYAVYTRFTSSKPSQALAGEANDTHPELDLLRGHRHRDPEIDTYLARISHEKIDRETRTEDEEEEFAFKELRRPGLGRDSWPARPQSGRKTSDVSGRDFSNSESDMFRGKQLTRHMIS